MIVRVALEAGQCVSVSVQGCVHMEHFNVRVEYFFHIVLNLLFQHKIMENNVKM